MAGCNQNKTQSQLPSASPTATQCTPLPSPSPSPTPLQETSIGHKNIKLRRYEAASHKLKYAITGEYPFINSRDPKAIRFNRAIQTRISKQYAYATRPNRKDFYERGAFSKDDPLETAEFGYEILFANEHLLSIRFHDITYSAGAAHPLENYFSLNFDIRRGTVLQLVSVFKPNTNFTPRLAELCSKGLEEQDVLTSPDAIEAEFRRHVEWNITRDGLVINFDRCSVTSCNYGERSVAIGYDQLKNILRPNGPTRIISTK